MSETGSGAFPIDRLLVDPPPGHSQASLPWPFLVRKYVGKYQERLLSLPLPLLTACCPHCGTELSVLRHQQLPVHQIQTLRLLSTLFFNLYVALDP